MSILRHLISVTVLATFARAVILTAKEEAFLRAETDRCTSIIVGPKVRGMQNMSFPTFIHFIFGRLALMVRWLPIPLIALIAISE